MEQIREAPMGVLLLWVIALGLFALAIWQIAEAFLERNPDTKKKWGYRDQVHRHRRRRTSRSRSRRSSIATGRPVRLVRSRRRRSARSCWRRPGGVFLLGARRPDRRRHRRSRSSSAASRGRSRSTSTSRRTAVRKGIVDLRRRRLHREGDRDRASPACCSSSRRSPTTPSTPAGWMPRSTRSPRCRSGRSSSGSSARASSSTDSSASPAPATPGCDGCRSAAATAYG